MKRNVNWSMTTVNKYAERLASIDQVKRIEPKRIAFIDISWLQ